VSSDLKNPGEFRRYRQFLTSLYLAIVGLGGLLITASVIAELLFHEPIVELRGPVISTDRPDPALLLDCNEGVRELLESLGRTTSELMTLPVEQDPQPIKARWEESTRAWRTTWDELGARCRFRELVGKHMGLGYDLMARIHGDLPVMRLKYQSLLVRFADEQATEVARMRRELDLSRQVLEKRAAQAPSP
jgi:hypothetical protein